MQGTLQRSDAVNREGRSVILQNDAENYMDGACAQLGSFKKKLNENNDFT